MGPRAKLIALVGVVSLLPSEAAAASAPPATVQFTYALGSHAQGHVSGACEGRGAFFPDHRAGRVELTSQGGVLHLYQTWKNYTMAVYYQIDQGADHQTVRDIPVPPGRLVLEWDPQGRAMLLGEGALRDGPESFPLRFEAQRVQSSPLTNQVDSAHYYVQTSEGVFEKWGAIPGWARTVELTGGSLHAEGNATFYLEGAAVTGENGFHETVPPRKEVVAETPSRQVGIVTVRYHHALLDVKGFRLDLPAFQATPVCRATNLTVDGRFTAYDARGRLGEAPHAVDFAERELTLEGRFDLQERPEDISPEYQTARAGVLAEGAGRFRSVQLDFSTLAEAPSGSWETGLLIVGGAAAVGVAAWKLLGWLFTRLRQERVLVASTRRRVYDAIQARPGVTFPNLRQTLGLGDSTLRYQARVLHRSGLIRSLKFQGAYRLLATGASVDGVRRSLVEAEDPKVAQLVKRLGPEGVLASRLVEELQAQHGLSRSGSWKVIGRALEAQLVVKERNGKGVMVRATG